MVAVPDTVSSSALTAFTTTFNGAWAGGAVNRPSDVICPVPGGETDHVTLPEARFETTAVNCCVWPALTVADVGVTITVGWFSVLAWMPLLTRYELALIPRSVRTPAGTVSGKAGR